MSRYRVQGGARHLAADAQGVIHGASEAVSHFAHDAGHRVEELAGGARNTAVHLADDLMEALRASLNKGAPKKAQPERKQPKRAVAVSIAKKAQAAKR